MLHGFDPYLPLYSLIHDYNFKLVSLELFFTLIRVYSTTMRICFINTRDTFVDEWLCFDYDL